MSLGDGRGSAVELSGTVAVRPPLNEDDEGKAPLLSVPPLPLLPPPPRRQASMSSGVRYD